MLEVPRPKTWSQNFDKLSIEQQSYLRLYWPSRTSTQPNHWAVRMKLQTETQFTKKQDILDNLAAKRSTTDDRPNPDAQNMNMHTNDIDLKTLFTALSWHSDDMPVWFDDRLSKVQFPFTWTTWKDCKRWNSTRAARKEPICQSSPADIEVETFHESNQKSAYVSKLYEYINGLKFKVFMW